MKKSLMIVLMLLLSLIILSESPNLQNLEKTDGGYLISDSDIIVLANYIKNLREENIKLSNQASVLQSSLNTEREKAEELIKEKDNMILQLEEQIKNYKKINSYSQISIIEKLFYVALGVGVDQLFLYIIK